jgi:hypothetical protein
MKKIPTDYVLLKEIYKRYKNEFENFNPKTLQRTTKIYVPIDIESLALHYKVDPEIIFGRLNNYFNELYGYKNDDGSLRPFFAREIGKDKNAVNFPQLATILVKLKDEDDIRNRSFRISIIAIIISLISLYFSVFNK